MFKDSKTDTKKKSARGLLKVEDVNGELTLFDNVTNEEEKQGLLDVVFEDGVLIKEITLASIREKLSSKID